MYQRSLSKNALIHLLGGVVAAGGQIILAPIYLRLLNSNEYGLWSQFLLFWQFVQPVFSWGLLSSIARMLVDANDKQRQKIISAGMRLSTCLNIVVLISIATVFSVLRESIAEYEIREIFLFSAIIAALNAYPLILMGVHLASNNALKYRSVALTGFILQVVMLGITALLVQLEIKGAVIAQVIASGFYAAFAVWQLSLMQVNARPDRFDYMALLSFGMPIVLYTLIGQASDFVTRSFVATQVNKADFGTFSAGFLFASIIAMISSAINLAWIPHYYRKASAWNASGLYSRFVEAFVASTALFAASIVIFSDELLTAYSGGSVKLPVSTVAGLVIASWLNSAVWMSLTNPLFQLKRMRTVLGISVAATALSMPLTWLLIIQLGLTGASWGLAINAFILCSLAALALRNLDLHKPTYLRLILLMLLMLLMLSGPWLNWLYLQDAGIMRVGEKLLLIIVLIIFAASLFLKKSFQTIKLLEAELNL
ncbi:lipopolysaccharide biosynthesis protein [Rhodoferax bucti]|uniref:lipopolysaccharide biosynthesis protein n=1 Tax=Rhodoferax bucti TaxID=2576305 RepID=UPI0011090370|nr:oligosaccharide flippase family protein [Rhodoferax bucti]